MINVNGDDSTNIDNDSHDKWYDKFMIHGMINCYHITIMNGGLSS